MRIPKSWVPLIVQSILDSLLSKEFIEATVSNKDLFQLTEEFILEELMVEDRVNDEVREILKSHEGEIERKHLDYKMLFDMTKRKLVKERDVVL